LQSIVGSFLLECWCIEDTSNHSILWETSREKTRHLKRIRHLHFAISSLQHLQRVDRPEIVTEISGVWKILLVESIKSTYHRRAG
jgi:hypothetical protein